MASENFIKPTPLSLTLVIIACFMLWLGGSWWFMLMAIVAVVAFFELVGLYKTKAMKKEWPLFGLLSWAIYIAIAFYGFWSWREEAFETPFSFFIIVATSDIAIYYERKFINRKKSQYSWEKSAVKFFVVVPAIANFLYLGNWNAFFVGAIFGAVAQFGNMIVSLLKESAGVKNSNILMPEKAGMLDRIGGYLIIGVVLAYNTISGGSD